MKKKKNSDKKITVIGTFIGNSAGFGFVESEELKDDLFIPEKYTADAFHLDKVEAQIMPKSHGARTEAKIIRIVERHTLTLVGTFEKSKPAFGFVVPDSTKIANDIFVRSEDSLGAVDGHKVVVEITDYGTGGRNPEGRIVEILGHIDDPGVDILSIVKGFGIEPDFPEKVINQAARVPDEIIPADLLGRLDLREEKIVTIDGEDSKDLDDAVSLTKEGDCYILGVHIADVSNYVQESSALDREALNRGTSVYLVDRCIPMLPHRLCNGICSLNEGVDRLTLSCIMKIDHEGRVVDSKIAESVINSSHRMTYTSVNRIIADKDEEERAKYSDVCEMLDNMHELSGILRTRRHKRGAIDFDFAESRIMLDENGNPVDIVPSVRNDATKLIEDFMLAANETVAEHFFWLDAPFVYRTHEKPDPEKITRLAAFVNNYGYHIHMVGDEIFPKEIQKLLTRIEDTPEADMISRMTLRSMQRAKYSTDCDGHFGLACKYYCHFTSPIRRYPDLQIHRIIKDQLRERLNDRKKGHYAEILPLVADASSRMERRADEAERETEKLKKAQYMLSHIGEEYEGVVSGITEWGVYVELENTVEGLIHVSKLRDDHYTYDDKKCELKGTKHGKKITMGQKMLVCVDSADTFMRTVDFSPADSKKRLKKAAE